MIFPPLVGQTPLFGIWEVGSIAFVVGLMMLIFQRSLRRASLIPLNDPRLEESLHYHN
jgi:hypothetical protein